MLLLSIMRLPLVTSRTIQGCVTKVRYFFLVPGSTML